MRAGLLALSAFVAVAALTTFGALRRERKLTEARTTFVANVSHELRTPLASILLMAENLESGRAGDNASRYHASIRREALRLRRLVDDVLDFSRLERGKSIELRVEDANVAEWLDGTCADAATFCAQAGASLACTRGELPARASFDREALRRAVFNLVDNALRHSGEKSVALHLEQRGRALVIAVSDRGRGIPERKRREVFEPFARLAGPEAMPGAGLGLAIVRDIARAHGGTARLGTPSDGAGAVFEIEIPLLERDVHTISKKEIA
jgi:signal transduction histidine kinase